ncbi:MAG: hypothetical protein P1U36_00880 [Legionellaceae bacterium]|nr:hypothetical protein [Legionellaceae bacterium]
MIVVVCWLYPCCKRLTFVSDREASLWWFYSIAIIFMTIMIYCSQMLLEDKLTEVVHLDDIEDIRGLKYSKFFSPRDYVVKKNMMKTSLSLIKLNSYSYKYSNGGIAYAIDLYFVFPVFSKKGQELVAWVGIDFHKTTDHYHERNRLKNVVTEYIADSFRKIQALSVDKFYYLELLADDEVNDGFKAAVKKSQLKTSDDPIVLRGGYQPLKNRLAEDFADFFVALIISILIWFTMVALLVRDDTKKESD